MNSGTEKSIIQLITVSGPCEQGHVMGSRDDFEEEKKSCIQDTDLIIEILI